MQIWEKMCVRTVLLPRYLLHGAYLDIKKGLYLHGKVLFCPGVNPRVSRGKAGWRGLPIDTVYSERTTMQPV